MKNLPEGWEIVEFKKCIEKDSIPSKIKIKNSEFKNIGKYPIIDQGEKFIAGYYDDSDKLFPYKGPVVIFGDHTKRVKYVDFEFCVGADGTKVLIPKNELFDTKFFYYQLKYIPIESAGYSRHYRFLLRKFLRVPPLPIQKQIVSILERAEKLKEKRKQANEETSKLLQSIFLEMFGDPRKNEKKLQIEKLVNVADIIMGQSPPGDTYNSMWEGIPFFQGKAEFGEKYPTVKKWCTKPNKISEKNDILMSVRAPVGSIIV